MGVMVELALVLVMNLARVLVMVDQEVYMEVGEGIVAVAVTILIPGRFPKHCRSCIQVSWLLHPRQGSSRYLGSLARRHHLEDLESPSLLLLITTVRPESHI